MALGDTLDGPWQIELRGVHFDGADCLDSGLIVTDPIDGLGVPPTRDGDVPIPMRHGLFPSPQFLGGRQLVFGVAAIGTTSDEFHEAVRDLGRALAPVDPADSDLVVELAFTLDTLDRAYFVRGKPQRAATGYRVLARVAPRAYFSEAAVCEFLATDPRVYGLDEHTANLTLGESSGGHGFPLGFPHGFGTATAGGANCENAGSIETYPTITVTAGGSGASAISLINTTTGAEWEISLSLDAGDTLVVDMGEQTALLNGTADRSPFVIRPPSEWWALLPGDNEVTLVASGVGTSAVVAWHDAYLL